jgi:hypothetical protein
MNIPKFLITEYLESSNNDFEQLRKTLFDKSIFTKDYTDDDLILIYHKYDVPITSELERECRSLVVDKKTLKIVSYSCETPIMNEQGKKHLLDNPIEKEIINTCYEGTYLSVFNHNDKWYVSTRRCLDSHESVLNKGEKSHYQMFEEILLSAGYESFSKFTDELNPNHSYYFVLIHHLNKHLVDYTNLFGESYGRLCLTTIRDTYMNEIDIYTEKVNFATYDNTKGIIFVPEKLESINDYLNTNELLKHNSPIESEGIVIKNWSNEMSKYHLIKLQNINYQFALILGTDKNIYKGLIYLYQQGKLIKYINENPDISEIKNPQYSIESYKTFCAIDAIFKVCASEIFELFKILWSIKDGKHNNKELYNILPPEYKNILYVVRGLYYKKKAEGFVNKTSESDIRDSFLKFTDIYNLLKDLPCNQIYDLLWMRKLMFNLVRLNSSDVNMQAFSTISSRCNRIHLKLCAIFTNIIYPNSDPTEVPPIKI